MAYKPRERLKHKFAIIARIENLQAKLSKNDPVRKTLATYAHFVGCEYLNDDGLNHVEVMLNIQESGL